MEENVSTAGAVADPRKREAGSTIPVAICASIILIAMLVLAFDFGAQLVVAERNNSDLQICRENLSQTASGFLVKNSSDPAREVATQAVESLRDQGFTGQIAVYVAEAPKGYKNGSSQLADSRRLISVKIIMLDGSTAMFSRLSGVDKLPVYTDMTFSISPYSAYEAWRPYTGSSVTKSSFYSREVTDGSGSSSYSVASGGVENLSWNDNAYNSSQIWTDVLNEMNAALPSCVK